jgi:hypothetical protein
MRSQTLWITRGPLPFRQRASLPTQSDGLPVPFPMSGEMLRLGDAGHETLHRRVRPGLAYVGERAVFAGLDTSDNLRVGRVRADQAVELFPEVGKRLETGACTLSATVVPGPLHAAHRYRRRELGPRGRGPGPGDRDRRHRARAGARGSVWGLAAAERGVGPPRALLVLPDGHVAFRYAAATEDAEELLSGALRRILGHA